MTGDNLDNPVWHSLSETHQAFVINEGNAKFYQPEYCPFGGLISSEQAQVAIAHYASMVISFYIVGEQPALPPHLKIKTELVCYQMICHDWIKSEASGSIRKLVEIDGPRLYELVNRVQPGYFRPETNKLGDYYGIFKNGELIAAAGERMKMNNFTEVSAVVTDPRHTGKGYASQLIAHTVNTILDQGKTPCLHVAETNHHAVRLYQKLGFIVRRKISFWNIAGD
jgi:predicted GNAT family acetyltransferase